MEWTKSILSDFIEMYKARPCLWKQNSEDYKNKNLKNSAYEEIVEFLKRNGLPGPNIRIVKEKIQNIRRTVRKERQKVEKSMRTGTGADDVYKPTVWYYNLLVFTFDNDPVESTENLSSPRGSTIDDSEEINDTQMQEIDDECIQLTEDTSQLSHDSQQSQTPPFKRPQKTASLFNKNKKKKVDDNVGYFLQKCTEALDTSRQQPDEYEAMGITVAAKLKKMAPGQQILLELLIQKVLTRGLLGHLKENTDITDVAATEFATNSTNQSIMIHSMQSPQTSYANSEEEHFAMCSASSSNTSNSSLHQYYTNLEENSFH